MNRRRFIISCGTLVVSFWLPIPKLPFDSHKAHVVAHVKMLTHEQMGILLRRYYLPGVVAHLKYHVTWQSRLYDKLRKK